jgi:hypothetical protein
MLPHLRGAGASHNLSSYDRRMGLLNPAGGTMPQFRNRDKHVNIVISFHLCTRFVILL